MSLNKLPPIDFSKDVERYKAIQESTEVSINKCKHKQVKYVDGGLKCVCGAGWTGGKLNELYKLLTS